MSLVSGDSFMAETRDIEHSDPEEANRQLRAMLQNAVREARRVGKWLVLAQLVVAAATVVFMCFTGVTVWLTSQQMATVRTSMEQAQQQFHLSQRPWVAVTDLRLIDVEIAKKPRAVMRIANKGLTPAKLRRTRLYILLQRELPTEFSYPFVSLTSPAILLPDSSESVSTDYLTEISHQIMTELDNGEVRLFAYGFAEYEDPWGTIYTPTRFCVFWEPKTKTQAYCPSHNTVE